MFSNTDVSLYSIAKSSLLFIRKRLVRPGWATSCPRIEMMLAKISKDEIFDCRLELSRKYKKECMTSAA